MSKTNETWTFLLLFGVVEISCNVKHWHAIKRKQTEAKIEGIGSLHFRKLKERTLKKAWHCFILLSFGFVRERLQW